VDNSIDFKETGSSFCSIKHFYMLMNNSGLGIDPDDLMAVMIFESWCDPGIKNHAGSSGIGLVQFLEKTARSLGTTTQELANMTGVEQLEYVYEFYKPFAGKMDDLEDVYMVTLRQIAVGENSDYPLFEIGDGRYEKNEGLDLNHDGKVTKQEATEVVIERRRRYE